MKFFKTCPMFIAIVVSSIFITTVAVVFANTVYADYKEGYDPEKAPIMVLPIRGATEGVFPWNYVPEAEEPSPEMPGSIDELMKQMQEDTVVEGPQEEPEEVVIEETVEEPEVDISAGDVSANDVELVEEKVYEPQEVTPEYFDDALFIGDSRTVGLSEYCQELDEHATFYAKVSLSIYTVMKKEFIKTPEGTIGVEEALSNQQFGKIYISLGLNEIGTGTDEYFVEHYMEVVNRIRELQPDAIIYIQGIMHVTERKSNSDKNFNNVNVDRRNAALSQLADNQNIFYIDMNEAVDDGNGNLDGSLSFDDIHLKASSYQLWYDYLRLHAIVKD